MTTQIRVEDLIKDLPDTKRVLLPTASGPLRAEYIMQSDMKIQIESTAAHFMNLFQAQRMGMQRYILAKLLDTHLKQPGAHITLSLGSGDNKKTALIVRLTSSEDDIVQLLLTK